LFFGLERAHGTYNNIDIQRADGKLEGTPKGVWMPVTDELWSLHLLGQAGLGITPIRDDATVVFGAIDIDVYAGLDHTHIAILLQKHNVPMLVCRSKSGGLHGYIFTKTPVSAAAMQEKLRDIAALLGHGSCEIFPKQTRLLSNDMGAWINMPYFDADNANCTRRAIRPDGEYLSAEEFLDVADEMKVDVSFFTNHTATTRGKDGKEAFPDGPPCLNHLVQLGFPEGTRNRSLSYAAAPRTRSTSWIECRAASC